MLYPSCKKSCKRQMERIQNDMQFIPFRLLQNLDDFLVSYNTSFISWKKCVVEFRQGEFSKILDSIRKENSVFV